MSAGGTSDRDPRATASACVASVSGVATYATQWGGTPAAACSGGSAINPPIGAPDAATHIVYDIPGPMSKFVVVHPVTAL
jgi:hypothetical protein